jgi:hypothetical protein
MEEMRIEHIEVEPAGGGISFFVVASMPVAGELVETEETSFTLSTQEAILLMAQIEGAIFQKQAWDELMLAPASREN